jgi:hypothetical protein
MANVARGGEFLATFKANATLSTLYKPVYVSASGTVAEIATVTSFPIGTVAEKSTGGAGSAVSINLFRPTQRSIAYGAITAGARVMLSNSGGYVDATTGTVVAGIAVTGTGVSGETFELYPINLTTALA